VEDEIFAAPLKAAYLLPCQFSAELFYRKLAHRLGIANYNPGEPSPNYMRGKLASYGLYFR
jgi:hypothetical protein